MNDTSTKQVYIEKRGREDIERYVAVNGRRMMVACGRPIYLPLDLAEVVEHSCAQDRMSDEFIAEKRVTE